MFRNGNQYSNSQPEPGDQCKQPNHLCGPKRHTKRNRSYFIYLDTNCNFIRRNRGHCNCYTRNYNNLYCDRDNRNMYRNSYGYGYCECQPCYKCQFCDDMFRTKCYTKRHRRNILYLDSYCNTIQWNRSFSNSESDNHNNLYGYRNYGKLYRNRNEYGNC
jgi:hypothetical protein